MTEACYLQVERIAENHREPTEEEEEDVAQQGVLLDEPVFPKEIVERALWELLGVEMSVHLGAAPYERSYGPRSGHELRALRTRVGTTLDLPVPQDSGGTFFSTRLLPALPA